MVNKLKIIINILIILLFSPLLMAGTRDVIKALLINENFFLPSGWVSASLNASQNNGYGTYTASHMYMPSPMFFTNDMNLTINYGLTDVIDFLFSLDYLQNKNELRHFDGIGDTTLSLGYNIIGPVNPNTDLRVALSLLIPTGRYQNLRHNLFTTDATGGGSYQPALGFTFSHNFNLTPEHSLTLFSNLVTTYAYQVNLSGISAFGGSPTTLGKIRPGHFLTFLIGGTYSLTEKWSISMDYSIYTSQPSSFKGKIADNFDDYIKLKESQIRTTPPGQKYQTPRTIFNSVLPTLHNIGGINFLGNGSVTVLSLDPSLSYNFAKGYNLVFTMSLSTPGGRNTTAFYKPSITLTKTIASS